ncbi:gamma-glutamylcyclotransferase family protein [Desulfomonile tiedjei]|uniref:AIG2-like family protein n=1 Tax=Desulfomonile tiedjei (strain ATCC 49306 / DSM 6799 / DCB-1) TaxID=706587 RepID=I4C4F1_DESTA|nr:gamma-glutamylcyclotransferase family protein [Desulfomonile tiedjei]AFM24442.1 AIG2-like family protein [Desulfomonile tiedjei DSM 6799]
MFSLHEENLFTPGMRHRRALSFFRLALLFLFLCSFACTKNAVPTPFATKSMEESSAKKTSEETASAKKTDGSSTREDQTPKDLHSDKDSKTKDSDGGRWEAVQRFPLKTSADETEKAALLKAASDIARTFNAVHAIKLCRNEQKAEWWIVLYLDHGPYYEVKQFVWTPVEEDPQPFTILERVSRGGLKEHLSKCKRGAIYQVLERSHPSVSEKNAAQPSSREASPVKAEPKVRKDAEEENIVKKPTPPARSQPAEHPEKLTKPQVLPPQTKTPSSGSASEKNQENLRTREQPRPERKTAPVRDTSTHSTASKIDEHLRKVEQSDLRVDTPGAEPKNIKEPSAGKNARTERPTYYVFLYGSDMNHSELLDWLENNDYDVKRAVDGSPGVLKDYDFVWNYYSSSRKGGAVNIQPKPNSQIWGVLLEVEDTLLQAFDEKAGHPRYYSRGDQRLPIKRLDDGKTVFAWVYKAHPSHGKKTDIWPTREYKQKIIEAAKFWGFPNDYLNRIASWPVR